MIRYEASFLVSAVLISYIGIFNLISWILDMDILAAVVLVGILGLWWLAYVRLRKQRKGSFAFSWTLLLLVCLALISQLVRRVVFIVENGGMEGPEGYGSPVAFMIGMATEGLFLIVFGVLALFGLSVILEKRGKRPNSE